MAWALVAGLAATACASSSAGRPAAGEAADQEFETQADALAAGVYEPFVHPDSLHPAAAVRPSPVAGLEEGPDPSTEELLGTLGEEAPYNAGGEWTLQLGAFESETGALVRIREIARDFPQLARWYVREGDRVRVFAGRFADRAEAERERARVAQAGYPDIWVTRAP